MLSSSAKELEHYKRVRNTFEGPSKDEASKAGPLASNRVPVHAVDGHLEPPVLNTRPKMKTRTSTAKPKVSLDHKGRGKGKAAQWHSDDDDDDDAYVTSNDFVGTPESKKSGVNGAFGDVAKYDDEELYQ